TYNGKYIKDIEAYYRLHYPERELEFINVGLPSETVSGLSEEGHADGQFPRPDLHERLERVLEQTKPDLVFASYGMNDGIYQPLDKKRFEKFRKGILWLHEQVENSGAKIVHLTPSVYDEEKGGAADYDLVLEKYSDWLIDQRDERKWEVVDIHQPMKSHLEERRINNPGFALAEDGVHPGDEGHWLMAREVLRFLGEERVAEMDNIEAAVAGLPHTNKVLKAVDDRQNLMRDAWLTATGHT